MEECAYCHMAIEEGKALHFRGDTFCGPRCRDLNLALEQ